MPIENRNLEAGSRLVARHKGKEHVCEVVRTDDGLRYRVAGKSYNSPSSAGVAVTAGVAVNGWRFWSLDGDVKSAKERKAKSEKPAKSKTTRTVKPKTKKKGAKKATKKSARAATAGLGPGPTAGAQGGTSHDSYVCGVCPETFPTLKAATRHALKHTQH